MNEAHSPSSFCGLLVARADSHRQSLWPWTRFVDAVRCRTVRGHGGGFAHDGRDTSVKRTVLEAGIGAALLWLALPPVNASFLGWVAPLFWLHFITRAHPPGWKEYLGLTAVGFLFWMAALHWLRLPHWATSFGWVALSFYLAWYLPAFVGLGRIGVHRCKLPLEICAPMVWAGLEVVRAHLLTGFTMASLAHTQYRWLTFIQAADLVGTYGLSGVMIFVSVCAYRVVRSLPRVSCAAPSRGEGFSEVTARLPLFPTRVVPTWAPTILAVVVMITVLGYGGLRLKEANRDRQGPRVRVALIQGSQDIRLEDGEEKRRRIHEHYLELALLAARRYRDLDVMVWPETVYGGFLIETEPDAAVPPRWREEGRSEAEFYSRVEAAKKNSERAMEDLAQALGTRLILGVETIAYTRAGTRIYNSAAFVDECGVELSSGSGLGDDGGSEASPGEARKARTTGSRYCYRGRYDKMHLVMFGEYVPFADRLPLLQQLTPLSTSTTPGKRPVAFAIKGLRFCPNICYESVIPHLIRNQIRTLRQEGQNPDVLVNLTNDGWFWGSSELDMHLICGVFRAVETRKPFLIAANTGFSAVIEPTGRITQQGPRRDVAVLVADVSRSPMESWYLDYGIVPNSLFAGSLVLLIGIEMGARLAGWVRDRHRARKKDLLGD